MLSGSSRKSPVGQMPNTWKKFSGSIRLPRSSFPVNESEPLLTKLASTSAGIDRTAARPTNATVPRIASTRPRSFQTTQSAGASSGAIQIAPPTLRVPRAAAVTTAAGSRLRGVIGLRTRCGSSAASTARRVTATSSFTAPHITNPNNSAGWLEMKAMRARSGRDSTSGAASA